MTERPWSRQDIINAVKLWVTAYGQVPAFADWDPTKARKQGNEGRALRWERGTWPRSSQVIRRFGSWSAAIEAAGFEPNRPGLQGEDFWGRERPDAYRERTRESRSPGREGTG